MWRCRQQVDDVVTHGGEDHCRSVRCDLVIDGSHEVHIEATELWTLGVWGGEQLQSQTGTSVTFERCNESDHLAIDLICRRVTSRDEVLQAKREARPIIETMEAHHHNGIMA